MFELEDLYRVAETTHRLCALPAIPTTGWCDLAAEALVPRDHRDILIVALANRSGGGLKILEPPSQIRLERERALWAWIDALPRDLTATGRMVAHIQAQADPMLCILSPIVGPRRSGQGSWVLIGGTITRTEYAILQREVRLLSVVMPRLAERCHIAFGNTDRPETLQLTPVEQRVLELLVTGRTVNEIATALLRSPHTVHDYVKRLHRKLGASSRSTLIARALGISEHSVRAG